MKKQFNLRTLLLSVILIALIIYVLITRGYISLDSEDGGDLFGISVSANPTQPLSAREASRFRRAEPIASITWDRGWDSDPFFYAEAETTDVAGAGVLGALFGTMDGNDRPSLKLDGISWNGNVGMALINGDILAEGDRVAGYQITKIAFDHVILRRGTSIVKVGMDD